MAGHAPRRHLHRAASACPAAHTAPAAARPVLPVAAMSRYLPAAALLVIRDALAEIQAAGITDPDASSQHVAGALIAHGWHITARTKPTTETPR